ncbi:hypothetical protein GIW57_13410 [Stenotrophomonas sp. PA-6-5C]|uniref:hypothetical protein n=1 Tax=Stenotrophomonas sp. PA-6-5C TaxID=2665487 RepID=UPI001F374E6E|nr:hypothetical protein [Stenotrophomonas sp. PA-6-5C]MCF5091164.1 hypothetical protein [Stenotrophomonas sp. PA-6-5C]
MRNQLDIFDHDPARLAKANRDAADQARKDMQFPPKIRQERVDHYTAEAERLEALAALCSPTHAADGGNHSNARNAR